ncbi:hypothetical protein IAR55_004377 [Kwoniella newhampshirensis]|uniref:Uncharacterized protein n=1 Tax=Kwoniella newhampshirensis TaxID=1651941 RepID=A0AAW0YJG4_9TREE
MSESQSSSPKQSATQEAAASTTGGIEGSPRRTSHVSKPLGTRSVTMSDNREILGLARRRNADQYQGGESSLATPPKGRHSDRHNSELAVTGADSRLESTTDHSACQRRFIDLERQLATFREDVTTLRSQVSEIPDLEHQVRELKEQSGRILIDQHNLRDALFAASQAPTAAASSTATTASRVTQSTRVPSGVFSVPNSDPPSQPSVSQASRGRSVSSNDPSASASPSANNRMHWVTIHRPDGSALSYWAAVIPRQMNMGVNRPIIHTPSVPTQSAQTRDRTEPGAFLRRPISAGVQPRVIQRPPVAIQLVPRLVSLDGTMQGQSVGGSPSGPTAFATPPSRHASIFRVVQSQQPPSFVRTQNQSAQSYIRAAPSAQPSSSSSTTVGPQHQSSSAAPSSSRSAAYDTAQIKREAREDSKD